MEESVLTDVSSDQLLQGSYTYVSQQFWNYRNV